MREHVWPRFVRQHSSFFVLAGGSYSLG
jgi:hypothetical protein